MSEQISPYSWQEILDKFPLDYSNWPSISRSQIPAGRRVRALRDKAAQYGDLLEHGNTYVDTGGVTFFSCTAATSGASTYTVAGITGGSSVTFTMATASVTGG